MAICLPGMPSRVNRAATSEMRVAPFVITTNCTTMRMMKMISPTTTDPPATKLPNASITRPATRVASVAVGASAERIRRVEATFSTSRYSVVASSMDGKTENSRALPT